MARASVKEQIIAAAVENLHRKGFNATSVEDITDAANVPKGSFYTSRARRNSPSRRSAATGNG
jgi:AcrR family transcriptional regulator